MDNLSLPELAKEIAERLSPLGLHMQGPPMIQGAILSDEDYDEDGDSDLDEEVGIDALVDRVKDGSGHAVIHMNLAVNQLAWTDRVLHPESFLDPDTVADLGMDKNSSMKEEIRVRLEAGEELSDIMSDLMKRRGGSSDD